MIGLYGDGDEKGSEHEKETVDYGCDYEMRMVLHGESSCCPVRNRNHTLVLKIDCYYENMYQVYNIGYSLDLLLFFL